jgi:hypothetical protein
MADVLEAKVWDMKHKCHDVERIADDLGTVIVNEIKGRKPHIERTPFKGEDGTDKECFLVWNGAILTDGEEIRESDHGRAYEVVAVTLDKDGLCTRAKVIPPRF